MKTDNFGQTKKRKRALQNAGRTANLIGTPKDTKRHFVSSTTRSGRKTKDPRQTQYELDVDFQGAEGGQNFASRIGAVGSDGLVEAPGLHHPTKPSQSSVGHKKVWKDDRGSWCIDSKTKFVKGSWTPHVSKTPVHKRDLLY